ncbi:MAG: DUF4252 domain-containing protein [Bacteroidetes bacterium HGW-Bacteroidetes-2]|jgi:hypothetical protein|nr:MAG: DUF4252 domain-containing protein [Bacteroidetes bacterium HGW-Bacteroidetes-2]
MKTITKFSVLVLLILVFLGCNSETSLQKYYVEKQKDNDFISLDIPSSLLSKKENSLTIDQKETLNSIKKMNLLALQNKIENIDVYEEEKEKVTAILSDEKYKTLMKFGTNTMGATLKFTGEEDAIDELIVFASDDSKGFALIRVIGDHMEPSKIIQLMEGVNEQNFDFSFLKNMESVLY